jgi:hypothetical protein
LVKRDEAWVEATLRQKNATVATTWLLTVDGGGNITFYGKDDSQ